MRSPAKPVGDAIGLVAFVDESKFSTSSFDSLGSELATEREKPWKDTSVSPSKIRKWVDNFYILIMNAIKYADLKSLITLNHVLNLVSNSEILKQETERIMKILISNGLST